MRKNFKLLKKDFGNRLKKIRKLKRLSQKELGTFLGYKNPRSDISNIENGRRYPSIEKLIYLSEKLLVSIDYLLLGKENFMIKDKNNNIDNNG